MSLVCLWNPRWRTVGAPLAELGVALLDEAPRVAVDPVRGLLWADARGLPAPRLALALLRRLGDPAGREVRAGIAAVPVAAEVAARSAEAALAPVESGHERAFLAPRALELLEPERRLAELLRGVGIERCGQLAALEPGAVEVRFGPEGTALWRLTRADDPRLLFRPIPPERPHASLDWVEYEVRSASGLVFAVNHLLETVCTALAQRGEVARGMVMEIPLANRATWRETLRLARPSADQAAWLRRFRDRFDRLVLPDAATGVTLRVESADAASAWAKQGDLFDRGFATEGAAEETLARLIDRFGERLFPVPEATPHPLPEARVVWEAAEVGELLAKRGPGEGEAAQLELQLLPEPRRVAVRVRPRRDHLLPTAYLDGREWRTLTAAAGPQRVSGGLWQEHAFAREYFRCVAEAGGVLWLFRDAREDAWYLHGWWD